MTKEQKLEKALEKPSLLVLNGSRLYGTNRPDSDTDTIGFILPPREYVFGLNGFDQRITLEPDSKVYSIKKFIHMALAGNTTVLETLYAPESAVLQCDKYGKLLRNNKEIFVSKLLYSVFKGFAISEYRKVKCVRQEIEHIKKSEASILDQIWDGFGPFELSEKAKIKELICKNKKIVELPATKNLGEKRKGDVEKYGFSVSNAGNLVRILYEGIELLGSGNLTLPRTINECELIKNIRNGKVDLEEIDKLYCNGLQDLDLALNSSTLPEVPNYKKAEDLLVKICLEEVSENIRNEKI